MRTVVVMVSASGDVKQDKIKVAGDRERTRDWVARGDRVGQDDGTSGVEPTTIDGINVIDVNARDGLRGGDCEQKRKP